MNLFNPSEMLAAFMIHEKMLILHLWCSGNNRDQSISPGSREDYPILLSRFVIRIILRLHVFVSSQATNHDGKNEGWSIEDDVHPEATATSGRDWNYVSANNRRGTFARRLI